MAFLGFDTSNYTTSAALYDTRGDTRFFGKTLEVAAGEKGVRQNDAIFLHTKSMEDVAQRLFDGFAGGIDAVGASSAPREAEGSYMPCFLSGLSHARVLAAALDVPCYSFSHQQGHIAAAAYGALHMELLSKEFLCWHVSGGTTELLYVSPSAHSVVSARRIGGTADASAGQIIDRAGVMLGIGFPCGVKMDELSLASDRDDFLKPSVSQLCFNLSGIQNKTEKMLGAGSNANDIARFTLLSLYEAIAITTENALEIYKSIPVLCCGGVMSNTLIRRRLEERFGAFFAPPNLSCDNALGIALLAAIRHMR